jgi:hypothetical protein
MYSIIVSKRNIFFHRLLHMSYSFHNAYLFTKQFLLLLLDILTAYICKSQTLKVIGKGDTKYCDMVMTIKNVNNKLYFYLQ